MADELYSRCTLNTFKHRLTLSNDTALRRVNPTEALLLRVAALSFSSIAQNVLPQDKLTDTHKLGDSSLLSRQTVSFLTRPAVSVQFETQLSFVILVIIITVVIISKQRTQEWIKKTLLYCCSLLETLYYIYIYLWTYTV